MPEALWADGGEYVELDAPRDDVVARILHRALRQAKRDWGELSAAWAEDDFEGSSNRPFRLEFVDRKRKRMTAPT